MCWARTFITYSYTFIYQLVAFVTIAHCYTGEQCSPQSSYLMQLLPVRKSKISLNMNFLGDETHSE